MTESDDIRWFRSKLVAARFGTLDEAEDARFNALRESSAECARVYSEFSQRAPEPESDDHLPAELIARWNKLGGTLQGREREMVMNHLERCDDCRDDLVALGFSVAPASASTEPHSTRVIRIVRESAGLWKQRMFAGWAVVATAAALVLILRMGTVAPVLVTQPTDKEVPPVAVAPETGSNPPVLSTAKDDVSPSGPFLLRDTARGTADDIPTFQIDPMQRFFEVDISARVTRIGDNHTVDLVLTDPAGAKTHQSSTNDGFQSERLTVRGFPLLTGLYRLDITEKTPDGPRSQTVRFRVVNKPRR